MPGASRARCKKGINGAGGAQLTDQVHIADIDSQFKRRGGHQHLQLAAFQALLCIEPPLFRQTAVMGRDVALANSLRQMTRPPALNQAAGIDEHQCGAMFEDELRQSIVHLGPHLAPTSPPRAVKQGTSKARSRERMCPLSTMVQSPAPGVPTKNFATSSMGFCVADNPTRIREGPAKACRRSSDKAKCEPRFEPAMAWISSTMTVRQVRSMFRPDSDPSRMYSDSGVLTHDVRRTPAHQRPFSLSGITGTYHRANLDIGQVSRGEFPRESL